MVNGMECCVQAERTQATVKVWDLLVRVFHWSMVAGFAFAYWTAENRLAVLHVLLGYALCSLFVLRLIWGFVGSRYARFTSFIFSPAETLAYVRSVRAGHPRHYYGHNPAGALMVFALLAVAGGLFLSGMLTLGFIDFEGPFAGFANDVSDETSYLMHEIHELLFDAALVLIPLHLLGVVSGSMQHKENLVRAMITGKKAVVSADAEER